MCGKRERFFVPWFLSGNPLTRGPESPSLITPWVSAHALRAQPSPRPQPSWPVSLHLGFSTATFNQTPSASLGPLVLVPAVNTLRGLPPGPDGSRREGWLTGADRCGNRFTRKSYSPASEVGTGGPTGPLSSDGHREDTEPFCLRAAEDGAATAAPAFSGLSRPPGALVHVMVPGPRSPAQAPV